MINFNKDNYSTELEKLNSLLKNSTPVVSPYGKRIIKISGKEVSLEDITKKVWAVGLEHCNRNLDDLSLKDRINGVEITEKLRNFYDKTNEEIENSGWFKKILSKVRDLRFFIFPKICKISGFHAIPGFLLLPPGWSLGSLTGKNGSIEGYFRGYNINSFTQEFGNDIDSFSDRIIEGKDYNGKYTTVCARIEKIREKIQSNPSSSV